MRCSNKVSQGQGDQQQTKACHPLHIHHCCCSSSRATRGWIPLLCSGHRWTCRQGFCCFVTDYLSFDLAKSKKESCGKPLEMLCSFGHPPNHLYDVVLLPLGSVLCDIPRGCVNRWIDMLICSQYGEEVDVGCKSRLREEGDAPVFSAA